MIDRWFILSKARQGGIRHGALPKFVPPIVEAPVRVGMGFQPSLPLVRYVPTGSTLTYKPPLTKEFENWEYRFWVADIDASGRLASAECRCCNSLFHIMEGRRLHGANNGCFVKLTSAFKLLLRDKKCVICNQSTIKQTWGVPLCGSGCMEAWCSIEGQPDSLTAALQLVNMDRKLSLL